MKKFTFLFALIILFQFAKAQGLEGVIVEKYYSSNAADSANAADNEAASILHTGSVTYRVFLDMAPGYKFIQIYGESDALDNVLHPLVIKTTTDFYNDPNNGQIHPQVNSVFNTRKNTTLIDSWISVGGVCAGKMGVLKTEDTDGSIGNANGVLTNSLGANFMGGVFGAPINSVNPNAQDGMMPGNPTAPTVLGSPQSLEVFDQTPGSVFSCTSCAISGLGGVVGVTPSNMVLVGQFTTNGVLCFSLNVQISNTVTNVAEIYVPNNAQAGEITYTALAYCSPVTNTTAPPTGTTTNPGEGTGINTNNNELSGVSIYPNPTKGLLIISAKNLKEGSNKQYSIYDITGRLILTKELQGVSTSFSEQINISDLNSGLYFVEVSSGESVSRRKIVKD